VDAEQVSRRKCHCGARLVHQGHEVSFQGLVEWLAVERGDYLHVTSGAEGPPAHDVARSLRWHGPASAYEETRTTPGSCCEPGIEIGGWRCNILTDDD
jgi:hypothetical protein